MSVYTQWISLYQHKLSYIANRGSCLLFLCFTVQTAARYRSSLIAWEVLSRSVAGLWHSRSWQSSVPVLPHCQPALHCIHARGPWGLITQKDPPWWALPTRPLWKRMGNPRKVGKVILLACSALSLTHTKPNSSHNFLYLKKKQKLSVLYSSLILSDIMTEICGKYTSQVIYS